MGVNGAKNRQKCFSIRNDLYRNLKVQASQKVAKTQSKKTKR